MLEIIIQLRHRYERPFLAAEGAATFNSRVNRRRDKHLALLHSTGFSPIR
jgi:hypothetical protein